MRRHKKKIIYLSILLFIILTVVSAFFLFGTYRKIKLLSKHKFLHLSEMARYLDIYKDKNAKLPAKLSFINYRSQLIEDKENEFTYIPGENGFELCSNSLRNYLGFKNPCIKSDEREITICGFVTYNKEQKMSSGLNFEQIIDKHCDADMPIGFFLKSIRFDDNIFTRDYLLGQTTVAF